jgi:hypothetical protein
MAKDILESYSRSHPNLVLVVEIEDNGIKNLVLIFKGVSSSLAVGTPTDPDIPVIPDTATILTIDIMGAPYNPRSPKYVHKNLNWSAFQELITQTS